MLSFGVIVGILWKITVFLVNVGFWSLVARWILRRLLRAVNLVTKKCVIPLIKDIQTVKNAHDKSKEKEKKPQSPKQVEAYVLD